MEQTIAEINQLVGAYAQKILALGDEVCSVKPATGKWSKKEVIGHLVDSAQNNLQRFVRAQYASNPKIVYAQDEWVAIQDYQDYPLDEVVQLWVMLNKHLCHVLRRMPPECYSYTCDTGKKDVELHDLKWLAVDYAAHLRHHLSNLAV